MVRKRVFMDNGVYKVVIHYTNQTYLSDREEERIKQARKTRALLELRTGKKIYTITHFKKYLWNRLPFTYPYKHEKGIEYDREDTACSGCAFTYIDKLLIHLFGNGIKSHRQLMKRHFVYMFICYKTFDNALIARITNLLSQYKSHHSMDRGNVLFKCFKIQTDLLVKVLLQEKPAVHEYNVESFFAEMFPTLNFCYLQHRVNGHCGQEISMKFHDPLKLMMKQVVDKRHFIGKTYVKSKREYPFVLWPRNHE